MTSQEVVRHFEGAAAGYTAFRNAWPLSIVRRQERSAIRDVMHVQARERVLDVGCGDGELLTWLRTEGARPIGIDISPAMTAECRRRGLVVSVQDLECPAFKPVFDWVVCFGALEFTAEPGAAVAALAGSLRPCGRLVLLFPKMNLLGLAYAAYHRLAHGVSVRLFRRREVIAWMQRAGLRKPIVWRDLSLSTLCVADFEAVSE